VTSDFSARTASRKSRCAHVDDPTLVSDAAVRHKAAVARREANAIRQARAEENRKRRALKTLGFHLSAMSGRTTISIQRRRSSRPAWRSDCPSSVSLPRIALDPCGGDGALRRGLAPFGIKVRLTFILKNIRPRTGT
jgi:hypothetical protein